MRYLVVIMILTCLYSCGKKQVVVWNGMDIVALVVFGGIITICLLIFLWEYIKARLIDWNERRKEERLKPKHKTWRDRV